MAGEDKTAFDVSLADASDVTNANSVVKAHKAAESIAGRSGDDPPARVPLGETPQAARTGAMPVQRKSSARPVDVAAARHALQASTYEDRPKKADDGRYVVAIAEDENHQVIEARIQREREERECEEKEEWESAEEGRQQDENTDNDVAD